MPASTLAKYIVFYLLNLIPFLIPGIIIVFFISAYIRWRKAKKWIWQILLPVILLILPFIFAKIPLLSSWAEGMELGYIILLFLTMYCFLVSLLVIFLLLVRKHRKSKFFYTVTGLIILSIAPAFIFGLMEAEESLSGLEFAAYIFLSSLIIALIIYAIITIIKFLIRKFKKKKMGVKEPETTIDLAKKSSEYFYKNLNKAAKIIAEEKQMPDRVNDIEQYLLEKYQEEPEAGLGMVRGAIEGENK